MSDGLSVGMFWAGAFMALTPMLLAGGVIAIWWWQRKKEQQGGQDRPTV